jgi:hypothetical protein
MAISKALMALIMGLAVEGDDKVTTDQTRGMMRLWPPHIRPSARKLFMPSRAMIT